MRRIIVGNSRTYEIYLDPVVMSILVVFEAAVVMSLTAVVGPTVESKQYLLNYFPVFAFLIYREF